MSDHETIVEALKKARSRIRRNLLVNRIASILSIFVVIAVLVKLTGLFILLSTGMLRTFWVVWFAALAGFVIRNLGRRGDLEETAGNLDRKAHLRDEVLSAYWFLNQRNKSPWMHLQIERAAKTVRGLDVRKLYPQSLPTSSYVVGVGIVLLITLNFAPLPFTPSLLFSTPMPDVAIIERQARLNEIDALLAEAAALNDAQDSAISEFQELVAGMRDADLSLQQTADQANQVEGLLDQGNLNLNSLLEGLEEIGDDLRQAQESEAAGEALSQRDLQTAAEELERLAEELGGGSPPSNELQDALAEAAENSSFGLEDLAEALQSASEALENQDAEAAEQSLMDASETLGELSDMVTSQQLQNQAAQQMEALREALQQQENQQAQGEAGAQEGEGSPSEGEQGQQSESGEQSGEPGASTPQEGEGGTPQEGSQPGSAEGASEFVPGESPEGAPSGQSPPITGDLQNMEPTGSGDTPTGLGFSPAQKTGDPTSLEVQLQLQTTLALANEDEEPPERDIEEEATAEERSSLDYRNVPSELTPAQQELLNQERIPREYQNVIKEYFQAIRPQPEQ
jgi:tetratricopeptide (TPR) repeat protein